MMAMLTSVTYRTVEIPYYDLYRPRT